MQKSRLMGACCAVVLSFITLSSHAALVGRDLDGNETTAEAYYDTDADITLLADANYAGTTMNWTDANNWAAGLDPYGSGIMDWRLPTALNQDDSGPCVGANCTGSEMGNLFYNVLGGVWGNPITTTHNALYSLFSNVQATDYWSATQYDSSNAWWFDFSGGNQFYALNTNRFYAWAVHSGDVGGALTTVPVPAAAWLFGSGLLGLIGVARRNRKQ